MIRFLIIQIVGNPLADRAGFRAGSFYDQATFTEGLLAIQHLLSQPVDLGRAFANLRLDPFDGFEEWLPAGRCALQRLGQALDFAIDTTALPRQGFSLAVQLRRASRSQLDLLGKSLSLRHQGRALPIFRAKSLFQRRKVLVRLREGLVIFFGRLATLTERLLEALQALTQLTRGFEKGRMVGDQRCDLALMLVAGGRGACGALIG